MTEIADDSVSFTPQSTPGTAGGSSATKWGNAPDLSEARTGPSCGNRLNKCEANECEHCVSTVCDIGEAVMYTQRVPVVRQ